MIKKEFVLSKRNDINFTDDQIYDILGEIEYDKLYQKVKFDFEISNKKLY